MSDTPKTDTVKIYTVEFSATCPKNKLRVNYALQIETHDAIMVEDLREYVDDIGNDYHESIADELHEKFSGTETMDAYHHGVHIRTIRP
jgi:hypothetical protein